MTFIILHIRYRKLAPILVLFIINTANLGIANANEIESGWKAWRNEASLEVKYRKSNIRDLIEVKAQLITKSTLSGFLLFIADANKTPNWLTNAKHSRLIEQISDNENIFTTQFDAFWPANPRDIVIQSRYWQNPDLSIAIAISDAGNKIPKLKQTVRIKLISASWLIKPTSDKQLEISYTFIADGKGNIPQWLANKVTLNSTWKTIKNLQRQLPVSKWQQVTLPQVKELNANSTK